MDWDPMLRLKKAKNKNENALTFRLLVIVTRSGSIRLFGQPGDSS